MIASMETIFAAWAAHAFLGEQLPAIGWAGAALILGASLLWYSSRPLPEALAHR